MMVLRAATLTITRAPYPEHVWSDSVSADELATRFRAGDEDALAQAFTQHARLIHTLALRTLGNHHDAEDVTQQVFIAAWRGRHTLDPEKGSLAGWLVGITRHSVADLLAQRSRATRNLVAVAASQPPAVPAVDSSVTDRVLVTYALESLGEPRATILRLSLGEGHTHEEIARQLDLPLGTVKSHIRRGLLQLRNTMKAVNTDAP
ncbi:MAG: RNA polymerase sigma factor [Propionicimonas sp.]